MNTRETSPVARMTSIEFANWRADDAVYARRRREKESVEYAIYAADGTFLDTIDDLSELLATAREYELEIFTVH